MAGKLQEWFSRNIWDLSDPLVTINGTLLDSLLSTDNTAGENVTPATALQNPTIYSAVNVRGNTISSLPVNVIKEDGKNKTQLTDHPAYYLLAHEPNAYMTASNFWKTIMLHVDIWGNGYAYINRDSRQNPKSFDIWEPWNVTITKNNGKLWYHYNGGDPESSRDILHYRFYSWDGISGRSPVMQNRSTIGMALKLDRYSAILMGKKPPGVLSYEGILTPEQMKQNQDNWNQGKTGDVKILSRNWKYQPMMMPADDAAFAVSKSKNKTDLLGIWQMPPQFVQDLERSTFSNAEQMDLVYAKHTITPICRNLELENNMKLFRESEKATTYTKFNMNGLLRGDLAARQAFYQSMVNSGIMARNEARSLEDLNPYEGGDDFLVQGAMVLADMLREQMQAMIDSASQPQQAPAAKNLNGKHYVN